MRKVFVIAILIIGMKVYAQVDVKWHTLPEALVLNQKEPRKFLVDVYTNWCGYCKKMDAFTFSNDSVAKYINENFYAVKFNAEMRDSLVLGGRTYRYIPTERRGYHEVAAILTQGRLSYPTIVYLDEKVRIVKIRPGFRSAAQLLQDMSYISKEMYKAEGGPNM